MKPKRLLIYGSLPGILTGILVGGVFFHGWFDENLHGDFYDQDTGKVDWLSSIAVFFGAFVVIFTIVSIFVAVSVGAYYAFRWLHLHYWKKK